MNRTVRSVDSSLEARGASARELGTTGRLVGLLCVLAEAEKDLTRAEIADRLGVPRATAHRTLRLLREYGIVEFADESKTYAPGRELYRIAALLTAADRLMHDARRVMRDLAARTGDTSLLALYNSSDHRVVWSLMEHGRHVLGYTIDFGARATLVWGASGRAMLAFLPTDIIDFVLKRDSSEKSLTRGVLPPSPDQFKRELELIRERRYATSLSHRVPHAYSVASPVFDSSGGVCAALSLSVPEMHVTDETEQNLAPLVVEAAAKLSTLLGAPVRNANDPARSAHEGSAP